MRDYGCSFYKLMFVLRREHPTPRPATWSIRDGAMLNFCELRQCEFRRIPLPRTSQNSVQRTSAKFVEVRRIHLPRTSENSPSTHSGGDSSCRHGHDAMQILDDPGVVAGSCRSRGRRETYTLSPTFA